MEGGRGVPAPIDTQEVYKALQPWLGTMVLSQSAIVEDVTFHLGAYAPYRQTLEDIAQKIESYLLKKINRSTNRSMMITLDNYQTHRLTLQDLNWMSDDVMGILFDTLTPFTAHFPKLNDYAIHNESLSAMRVLYLKYQKFFSQE